MNTIVSSSPKKFEAVRAVIKKGDQVLLIREANTYEGGANKGKWDFPGGKIRPEEASEQAIRRECREEVRLEVAVGEEFYDAVWRPVVRGTQVEIHGTFYLCDAPALTKRGKANEPKTGPDHSAWGWFTVDGALADLPLIKETADALRKLRELHLA